MGIKKIKKVIEDLDRAIEETKKHREDYVKFNQEIICLQKLMLEYRIHSNLRNAYEQHSNEIIENTTAIE